MDSIDFNYIAIVHNSRVDDYRSYIKNLYGNTEVFKMSVDGFLDRINEESVYYYAYVVVDDTFNDVRYLARKDFGEYVDSRELDALVELYDEVYIDSIRVYTAEQLGKDMTVLLFD